MATPSKRKPAAKKRTPVSMADTMAAEEVRQEAEAITPDAGDLAGMSPSELVAALAQARQDLAELNAATAGGTKLAPEVFAEKFSTDPSVRGFIKLTSTDQRGMTHERVRTDHGYRGDGVPAGGVN